MRVAQKLYNLIDEVGIWDAETETGLKSYDLIRISEYPMDCMIAGYIIYDLIKDKKIPLTYGDFEIYSDYDGVIHWDKKGNINVYVMATPFWDGECQIPINIQMGKIDEDGDEIYIGDNYNYEIYTMIELDRIRFKTIESLLKWYKNFYLPKTHEMINNKVEEYTDNLMDLFNKSKRGN
jgi:hypothetical protein